MRITGTIEPTPEGPNAPTPTGLRDVVAEAQDYDEGLGALREQVPAGWRLIAIRAERS